MVLHALDTPKMRRAIARPKRKAKGDDPERLRRELELLAASAADIGVREFLAARQPLEERLKRALAELEDETDVLAPIVGAVDIHKAWDGLELDRKRAVISAVVHEVRIKPADHGGHYDGSRIEVRWRV
jgi:hypothetical protein